jgi:hypothetical protein
MRYMMLIYSQEDVGELSAEEDARIGAQHRRVMQEASEKGILLGAEPLAPTSSATTSRMQNGKILISDGPFAETKEQLAGYYILDCQNLEEAMDWAAKIPTSCLGGEGCIEIRPMRDVSKRPVPQTAAEPAGLPNG